MNPLLAAGVLAAAHQLGIMPDSPIVASILGYLAGHHGHSGEEAEQLRAQLGHAQQRELALRYQLGQHAQAAQASQMQAALEAARQASQRGRQP